MVKIVHDQLVELMGPVDPDIHFVSPGPTVLMLAGLQGSGKTTTAGKLALHLRGQGRHPFLVPADVQRPAAIEQLTRLAEQVQVPVFPSTTDMRPVDISVRAAGSAGEYGSDTVILDTAGRLQVDEALMRELAEIKTRVRPNEILLVADAMTGQEAVNVARSFNEWLDLTGVILTKLEGDARGGAALSIRAVVDRPIKFVGVGEKLEAFESFYPDRMASRILGQGDVLTLIEKAQQTFDQEQAEALVKKLRQDEFTLEDFQAQIRQFKKIGSIEQVLGMIPGLGKLKQLKDLKPEESELKKVEAIIDSMTRQERRDVSILNAGRRRRVALGSGTSVAEVNALIKNFMQTRKMMKKVSQGGLRALRGGMPPM